MSVINSANIIRENRKTIKVCINKNNELDIYCPKNITLNQIENLLKPKEKLIEKKLLNSKKLYNNYQDIINFKNIMLLGKEYFVAPTEKVGKPYFTDETFIIPKKYYPEKFQYYAKKTLREISNRVIKNRVIEIVKSNKITLSNKVVIGNFKSKWGSCDNAGLLKLNWKLIMLPPKLIDFVIFHELSHLFELNHSKKFYKILENFVPDHRVCKKHLKDYSFVLTIY